MINAVLFDVIGTTVKEKDPGVIIDCLQKAFFINGIQVGLPLLKRMRGMEKKMLIHDILHQLNLPLSKSGAIYSAFKTNLENNLHAFSENDEVGNIFSFLSKNKIKIGMGTGLERSLFEKISNHLEWGKYSFHYIGISGEIGKSRPAPDMVFDMMKKLNLSDPGTILKVGDTIADIREGKNASVLTAVLSSGSQDKADLLAEKPDFFLYALSGIKEIILQAT